MGRIFSSMMFILLVLGALTAAVDAGFCSVSETAEELASAFDLSGKVVIVTGGDSGLGYATAATMAKQGATVIVATHNLAKGERAAQTIANTTGGTVYGYLLDLASFASVHTFAEKFTQDFKGKLDILFNNAGISGLSNTLVGHFPDTLTKDGFEIVFQVNYLGHFLLSELLLPALRNRRGRIVNTASTAHKIACRWAGLPHDCLKDWTNIPPVPLSGFLPHTLYGVSKMMQILHAQELAKRESASGVTAFSICPGFVNTGMAPHGPMKALTCFGVKHTLHQEVCPYSPQQGAAVIASVALQAQANHSGAWYTRYSGCQPADIEMNGFEVSMRPVLYDKSLEWVGLRRSSGRDSVVV